MKGMGGGSGGMNMEQRLLFHEFTFQKYFFTNYIMRFN